MIAILTLRFGPGLCPISSSSRPFSRSLTGFESSAEGSIPDCDKGDSSPSVSAAGESGCISLVRSVMDPVLVNLSEFDMRLLYVSRDRTKRFDNVPSDLPQTHFVTDQRMSQLVYPFVEICYNRQVFRLGLGMM
jgi:hypothetical protein